MKMKWNVMFYGSVMLVLLMYMIYYVSIVDVSNNCNSGISVSAMQSSPNISKFHSVRFNDISSVEPYESFNSIVRYSLSERPGFSISLPWMDIEQQNIHGIIQLAANSIQRDYGVRVDPTQLSTAHWRHLAGVGEEYSVAFETEDQIYSINVYRPLQEAVVHSGRMTLEETPVVHIIVPLVGRTDKLAQFLDRATVLFDSDAYLRLLLVCHGRDSEMACRRLLDGWRHVGRARLVRRRLPFSRGGALLAGARRAAGDDPLLLFLDVDVAVWPAALQRCRLHALRGRSVYFPVLFSEFSPRLVADLSEQRVSSAPPPVDSTHGHWRHYGFGMSCQLRSDFTAVSGTYLHQSGWGGEDVALYARYLRRLHVVRVLEPHMRHLYHDKQCAPGNLSVQQYRSCVFSQIENEGNKQQLGLMALRWAGRLDEQAHGVFRRPWSHVPANWAALLALLMLLPSLALNWKLLRTRSGHRRAMCIHRT